MTDQADLPILGHAEAAYKAVVAHPAGHGADAARLVGQARRAGDAEALVVALRAEAWFEHSRLDNRRAKALLDEAVRVAARRGLDERLGEVLVTRAAASHELGRLAAAQHDLDRAAGLVRDGHRAELALQQAALHQNVGRLSDAAALYRTVLADGGCPPDVRAKVANNLALLEAERGRVEVALDHLDDAAALAEQLGPGLAAYVAQSRAWVTVQAGRLPESLRLFEDAARRYEAAGLPLGEHYLEYSDALADLRLLPEARATAQRAAEQFERHGAQLMAAEAALRTARLALAAGEPDRAREAAEGVIRGLRRQRRTAWVAQAAVTAAEARAASGGVTAADLRAVRRSAATLERLGVASGAVAAHLTAGRLAVALGRTADAATSLRRAERLARRAPVLVRLRGRVAAALAARLEGTDGAVLRHCRAGLADLARYRGALPSMELRALASGHGAELGRLGLAAVVPTGSAVRVLDWMERTRAAALVPVDRSGSGPVEGDLAALRSVQAEITAARREAGYESPDLLARQAAIENRLRRAAWTDPAAREATAEMVPPATLRALLEGEVLVEYGVLEDRLLAAVVEPRRTRLVQLCPVAEAAREADALLFALRRLAHPRTPAAASAARRSAESRVDRLAELLLRPLRVAEDAPLVVVPAADLQRVPWSPLHPAPVCVAPSASFWARTRGQRRPAAGPVLLVAGPGLPGAVEEVEALAGVHGDTATVLVPPRSTAGAVGGALRTADLAHLACHGRLRADNPTFSALLLSDGPLTLHELAARGIAPHRMVLAACDAGADVSYPGQEVLGFVSALMARGTAGLVASPVPVPDLDTVPLMRSLHEHVRRGQPLPDALHAARSAMDTERGGQYVTWSAFTAYGAG